MSKMIIGAVAMTLAMAGASFASPSNMTEDEVQAGYEQAIDARLRNRPDVTEDILERLVEARPNAYRLRFDLGVAQAEQGHCVEASRSFARGADLAQTPAFERAAENAMADLCPRLAPIEGSLSFAIRYDSNINSGSADRNLVIGGFPITLTDDAVAQDSYGIHFDGGIAYNRSLSQAVYIVPSISFRIEDMQGSENDRLTLSPGVALRYRGDRIDTRFGPRLYFAADREGLAESGWGVAGAASLSLTAKSGLFFDASYLDVSDEVNALRDYTLTSAGVRYVRSLDVRDMVFRAGLSWNDKDYEDDLQDLSAVTVEVGITGSLTRTIGFDLSAGHTRAEGSTVQPFFGVARSDDITTVAANASFARFESVLGRPYLGVSASRSNSTFATKEFSRTSVNIGFTRSF